jgi:hypothetical protein
MTALIEGIGGRFGREQSEAGPDGLEVIAVRGPKPEDGDGSMAPAEWPAS